MNVKELNEKYQRLQNWESEYRKELISYINEAFAMHGNEFVLKPGGDYETWKEVDEEEQGIDVSEHFGTYFELEDRRGHTHEIYPTRIYRKVYEGGSFMDYVDGYDLGEGDFVEEWYIDCDDDSLGSIAYFINAVLEQEQEGFHSLKESNMEQQVREMYDKYMEEHGHKPQYLKCVVRWKDDGDEGLDNIALDQSADDEDCVSSVSGILALQDLIRYNEEDFEIVELVEMWGKEE